MTAETLIAERHLIFSEQGKSERKPLVIRIFVPMPVDPASVSFEGWVDSFTRETSVPWWIGALRTKSCELLTWQLVHVRGSCPIERTSVSL